MSEGGEKRCASCSFPLKSDANLLVLLDTFKSMLRQAGYNISSLNMKGDDTSPLVSLQLELQNQLTGRKRRRKQSAEQPKRVRKRSIEGNGDGSEAYGSCTSLCCDQRCAVERCTAGACDLDCDVRCSEKVRKQNNEKSMDQVDNTALTYSVFDCDSCTKLFESEEFLIDHLVHEHGKTLEAIRGESRITEEGSNTEKLSRPSSLGSLPADASDSLSHALRGASNVPNAPDGHVREAERSAMHLLVGLQEAEVPGGSVSRIGMPRKVPVAPCCREGVGHYAGSHVTMPPVVQGGNINAHREMRPVRIVDPGALPYEKRAMVNIAPYSDTVGGGATEIQPIVEIRSDCSLKDKAGQSGDPGAEFKVQEVRPNGRIPCQVTGCDATFGRVSTARRHFLRKRKYLSNQTRAALDSNIVKTFAKTMQLYCSFFSAFCFLRFDF